MSGDDRNEQDRSPGGQVDSDDTTQADAGMAGGTGTDEGQATARPMGTEPLADPDDEDED